MSQNTNNKNIKTNQSVFWVVGGYLIILLLAAYTVKTAIDTLNQVNESFRVVVEANNVKSQYMIEMRDAIRERILLLHGALQVEDAFDIDDKVQAFNSMARKFIVARDNLNTMDLTDKQKSQLKHQRETLATAQPILDHVIQLIVNGEERVDISSKMIDAQNINQKVTDELESMRLLQQVLAEQTVKTSRTSMEKAKAQIFLFVTILAVIASLILWAVINVIRKQNIAVTTLLQQLKDANDGLEEKVIKRTEELLESREDNARMGAELAITHKIQQMILPLNTELDSIQKLDIAASMKPAEEAGGDYYDVLHYHGKTIITIGDVTGHGLESSVVMLMTQAAVRTLAVSQIEDPVQFLHLLNQTIFDNLRRLDSYKNLTLMLAYYQNKQLTICGQHEDMLLLRKDGTSVESIDTVDFGFPIGIEKDIEAFLQPHHIDLESGDLVILYTDGIPEAENKDGEFYGLERLCEQILIHRDQSVQEIHDLVIANLYQFIGDQEVFDDVTLMVIRQN